jgi:hypothetical protein
MQYALLIYGDESAMASADQDDREAMTAEYMKFTENLRGSGAMVGATSCSRRRPRRPSPSATASVL